MESASSKAYMSKKVMAAYKAKRAEILEQRQQQVAEGEEADEMIQPKSEME